MRSKFSFLYANIQFNVPKRQLEIQQLKIVVLFSPIFLTDTKIIFHYNFEALLSTFNRLIGPPASAGRVLQNRVRPSFGLSVSFLRVGSLFFSETQHGVRSPYIVMCDRAGFIGKDPHRAKITKNVQKWPKNMVFGLFKKLISLVLSGICVKQNFLWFINIL